METVAFFAYALAFKLATIGSGALCLVLGYRLLSGTEELDNSEIAIGLGAATIRVTKATPGIVLATLGVAIIIATAALGQPSYESFAPPGDGSLDKDQFITSGKRMRGARDDAHSDAFLSLLHQSASAPSPRDSLIAFTDMHSKYALPLVTAAENSLANNRRPESVLFSKFALLLALSAIESPRLIVDPNDLPLRQIMSVLSDLNLSACAELLRPTISSSDVGAAESKKVTTRCAL